ncbi:hypothetical protein GCM10020331_092040 [Ectobacillus funiculus]
MTSLEKLDRVLSCLILIFNVYAYINSGISAISYSSSISIAIKKSLFVLSLSERTIVSCSKIKVVFSSISIHSIHSTPLN